MSSKPNLLRTVARCAGLGLVLFSSVIASVAAPGLAGVRGSIGIHDPSTIIKCKGRYYIYGTGPGIISKSSADGVLWTDGPAVFATAPAWVIGAAPGFNGDFWAPDIAFINGKYCLYYSVSSWASQQSAIGLATNPTLDPSDPAYQWTDQGIVIQSINGSPFNTIDPNVTSDANGSPWLAFGSYWNGIYLTQLDPVTGLRNTTNTTTTQLAYNGSIEASCLYRRGVYYYLFVNWGSCCDGVNSTYNVRVGRSTSITGPYLDRNGVDLRSNGGTLFAEASGKFAGPGHIGVLEENGSRWFSYHYYDAGAYSSGYGAFGAASFDIQPLTFTADDWPVLSRDWSAHYNFDADARDENGQYYGMLYGGATIQTDASRGRVLNLNGAGQYVRLPAGVANARTFTAVVKWNGGANWQRLFDFGADTSNYLMLTPSSSDGRLRCDIRVSGTVQIIEWANKLPIGVWTHVALTLDGSRAVLYVNGLPVTTNTAVTFSPYQTRAQTNHLGRSKFVADADFNGQISSFRVYARALSAYEIAAPVPVIGTPTEGATYWPGMTLSFSGTAVDFNDLPLTANQLTWRVERILDGATNVVWGPMSGVTNSSYAIPTNAVDGAIYRIALAATNGSGRGMVVFRSLSPANPPANWSSYYPFRTDATDANGHFNGTLQGGASIQSDAARGPVLNLSGVNQYVSLPSEAGDLQTFMAWVKWNGGAAWQRILDFGNNTTRYFVLTPMGATGKLRCNISVNGIAGEQILDAPGPLPVGVWTHVAVVLDGTRSVLYTNGVPVATNAAMNLVPADLNATNIWFGRSQFPDPYFNGQLSSVRMYSRPLGAEEIVAPSVTIGRPAFGSVYRPGDVISFNGAARDFYDASLVATSLTWTVQWRSNTTVTTIINNLSGVTNGSFTVPTSGMFVGGGAYRIQLVATDTAARKATNYVEIYPAAAVQANDWASYYPFSSNANDASNRFNGTLVSATIVTDATRGGVANLSGASQYVNLPAGASAANTISGWVKWNGGNAWQRIFDFGVDTTRWLYLTPKDGTGRFQCAITTDGSRYTRIIQGLTEFPTNEWVHVAVMFDGKQGVLYTNGQPAAVNNSVNLLPNDVAATKVYLGRSQFSADPYFNGRVDAVRLNTRGLPLAEIAGPTATILTPLASVRYAGGSTVAFSGRVRDYAETPLAAPAFTWAVEYQHDGSTDPVLGALPGVTNGTFSVPTTAPNTTNALYRVRLTGTDAGGLQHSATMEVPPQLVQVALASLPSGLTVQFESQAFATPTNVTTVAGMTRNLNAPSPQNFAGSNYNFVVWSDGGTPSHSISVPTINSSFTASFIAPEVALTPNGNGLVISWPDWANSLQLAAATNLAPPALWQMVTNVPTRSGTLYFVQLPMTEAQQFFRLQSP